MSRKTARKFAFELVFQLPFHENLNLNQAFDHMSGNFTDMSDNDKNFIYTEFKGVSENLELIDKHISENLKKWKIERIERELLAISRIAIYEMIFDDTIQDAIAINEALELAKQYSDETGRKFVHGLLSSVSSNLEKNKEI